MIYEQFIAEDAYVDVYPVKGDVQTFSNVHQVLMTNRDYIAVCYGSQVTHIPREEIHEIRVRFE